MSTIKKFHINDIKIDRVFFNTNHKWKSEEDTIQINTDIKIDRNIDGKSLQVMFQISLEGDDAPFSFLVAVRGNFSFDEEVSPEEAGPIANITCAAIMFPYLRETIADITRRAGFPPFHHSPINFQAIFKENKERAEKTKDA